MNGFSHGLVTNIAMKAYEVVRTQKLEFSE